MYQSLWFTFDIMSNNDEGEKQMNDGPRDPIVLQIEFRDLESSMDDRLERI